MARYADGTTVTPESSRRELERILERYGAQETLFGYNDQQIGVGFKMRGRMVKLQLPLPAADEERFHQDSLGRPRAAAQALAAHKREVRRIWRVLVLLLKSKMELVATEVVNFDDEFMPYLLLPDGTTVREHVEPRIVEAYRTGQMPESLLPALPASKVIALPASSGSRR